MSTRKNKFFSLILTALLLGCLSAMFLVKASLAASKVSIRYNGKTYQNTSVKLPVLLDGKTISKSSYKAIKINNYYMVPYTDVFRDGAKITCTKKDQKITLSTTENTLKMTIGKKKATLNGKTVTLPAAPLSVRYVSKKKTKVLVPVKYVAQCMGFSFFRSSSSIQLSSPLYLQYDGKELNYHDVQGTVYYNHKEYKTSSLPVIKLEGKYFIPAQELIENILGLEYSYQSSNGTITIENEDLDLRIKGTVGSDQITINGTTSSLGIPIYMVRNKTTKSDVVCVPAASFLKNAGYTRGWKKATNQYTIQSKKFFLWDKTLTNDQKNNTSLNYLYSAKATYSETKGLGAIKLQISGSSADILKTLTVKREKNVITLTIPSSQYLLDKNLFSNFGEIVDKMEITSGAEGSVVITLTCKETADYSYTVQNGVLEINILYTYLREDGSVTDYSLFIQKPEGVSAEDVTNQDMYPKSKAFKVIIKGDYVDYLKENPVIINNNTVKSVSITKSGSNTVIKVNTSKLRGYKIYVKNNSIVVSMGAPKNIYKSIVVLDAGHGGFDPGAQHKGTNEKDLNFKIMYTLMKPYFSDNAPDIKAYWTRTTDSFVTLADRAAFAKKVGADVFISLHMNSASNSSANGTEVYYSVSNNSKSFGGITSKTMATLFKNQLIDDLSTKNRGTKSAAYYVLKHNTVPSILIELGFLSGSADYSKLTNTSFQKKAAKSIYTGIETLFKNYPTGR